jgi:hypothetical protein
MPVPEPFQKAFDELKKILKKHAKKLAVHQDDAQWYYLNSTKIDQRKKPIGFAGVRIGKNYVSYYLMGMYGNSTLLSSMSPQLKKRMQGKCCFNFQDVDRALFKELAELTDKSYECMKKAGWL